MSAALASMERLDKGRSKTAITSTTNESSSSGTQHHDECYDYQQDWSTIWQEFLTAIQSPDDFNPFLWVVRLMKAGLIYVYYFTGLRSIERYWRPIIPLFGIGLIIFCYASYWFSLRHMIQGRWCGCTTDTVGHGSDGNADISNIIEEEKIVESSTNECGFCYGMIWNNFICSYLTAMLFHNYIRTMFTSPGVALPESITAGSTTNNWKSIHSQGGCIGIDPKLDVVAERKRVAMYGRLQVEEMARESETLYSSQQQDHSCKKSYFPSPYASFCKKCQIIRPPRCHHCSVCNRCVLQFDHHCIWLNNCIGYNNYLHFILTLFFLSSVCLYGSFLLFMPFYELMCKRLQLQGGLLQIIQVLYSPSNNTGITGILSIPTPTNLIFGETYSADDTHTDFLLKVVFYLLLGIGLVMSIFLSFHIKYIFKARTTLEHSILLNTQYKSLLQTCNMETRDNTADVAEVATNPFDMGWYKNFLQVLGPNWSSLFLPIPVKSSPPFIPLSNHKCT